MPCCYCGRGFTGARSYASEFTNIRVRCAEVVNVTMGRGEARWVPLLVLGCFIFFLGLATSAFLSSFSSPLPFLSCFFFFFFFAFLSYFFSRCFCGSRIFLFCLSSFPLPFLLCSLVTFSFFCIFFFEGCADCVFYRIVCEGRGGGGRLIQHIEELWVHGGAVAVDGAG